MKTSSSPKKIFLAFFSLALLSLLLESCAPSNIPPRPQGAQTRFEINGYLWRASLETLSFLPIKNLDPFSGVLVTDWRAAPQAPTERFRITAYILGRRLSADTLRVTVYRQTKEQNEWRDNDVSPQVALAIENLILSRARLLHLAERTPS